jgi:class 3 adenylate cyclase
MSMPARADGDERDVSVLFVDLRDYAALAESRTPREIFAFLSAYTLAVSEIVRARGGSLVEWSGDGAMAVFGAARELPARESSALAAAREIASAMAAAGLSVGVGVASGTAFVGSLPCLDKPLDCAVGNTTILASRLQALCREVGAAVVADERTFLAAGGSADERTLLAAGGSADEFVRLVDTPIRGRVRSETVYALPRAPRIAPARVRRAGLASLLAAPEAAS